MKLQPNEKTHLACSRIKDTRFATEHLLLKEDGSLVATNGKILAVIPEASEEEDSPGLIQAEAVQRAVARKGADKGYLAVSSRAANVGTVSWSTPTGMGDLEYPDTDSILEKTGDAPVLREVGVDAGLLYDLSRAIGAPRNWVHLHLPVDPTLPIRVTSDSRGHGVLQPLGALPAVQRDPLVWENEGWQEWGIEDKAIRIVPSRDADGIIDSVHVLGFEEFAQSDRCFWTLWCAVSNLVS